MKNSSHGYTGNCKSGIWNIISRDSFLTMNPGQSSACTVPYCRYILYYSRGPKVPYCRSYYFFLQNHRSKICQFLKIWIISEPFPEQAQNWRRHQSEATPQDQPRTDDNCCRCGRLRGAARFLRGWRFSGSWSRWHVSRRAFPGRSSQSCHLQPT